MVYLSLAQGHNSEARVEIDLSSNSLPGSMINHSSTAGVVYMFIMHTLV